MKTSKTTINNILSFSKTLSFLTDKNTRFEDVEAIKNNIKNRDINFNLN